MRNTHSHIQGRLLVKGNLILQSPLLIGTGHGVDSDLEILRDGTGRPFIPGTSWAGVLRSLLHNALKTSDFDKSQLETLLGFSDKNSSRQSALITYDLPLSERLVEKVDI